MSRFLYSVLQYLLLPLVLAQKLWRSRLAPAYRRRLGERFGFVVQPPAGRYLWIHAVSVGEALAAAPLIERLLVAYPDFRVAVTTTTPTGSERVRALFGQRVYHCYAPYDLPGSVRRFLGRVRPQLLVIMETELWPNLLHQCAEANIPVVLANARLSERSARGYGRVPSLTKAMLLRLQTVAAQTSEDGQRFVALGLPMERLVVTGSIKWDVEITEVLRQTAAGLSVAWRSDARPVLLAASTHPGEEAMLLDALVALRRTYADLLLVLVPRHPERFQAVVEMAGKRDLMVARRSDPATLTDKTEVLVGDTMGELFTMMGAARIVFVGGSLVDHGGHNVLEAAAWGVPVLTGPHFFNFQRVTEMLQIAGALQVVDSGEQLPLAVGDILADEHRYQRMADSGSAVIKANRGALDRLECLIGDQIVR
ncbi:MAG: 3-deoxy-D-manno-octulosonic-acid transferase [Halieaceae bacterium]|jgi:3-deoxy-D-manno-octulosonic-acid transferase